LYNDNPMLNTKLYVVGVGASEAQMLALISRMCSVVIVT